MRAITGNETRLGNVFNRSIISMARHVWTTCLRLEQRAVVVTISSTGMAYMTRSGSDEAKHVLKHDRRAVVGTYDQNTSVVDIRRDIVHRLVEIVDADERRRA
jgi:hypothetical protein